MYIYVCAGLSVDEKRRLLHCVVVGGGPTGVEFTGELSDFIIRDVREKYPHIKEHIKITLIEVHALICSFLSCTLFMFLKCFGNPKLLFYSGK